ncbi:hypothetical protein BO94DRAFT_531578 [Aspergillus sclerotioniger CBS 115572]|uniref:Xylanolytic transcriptional activator regulatory domain-containing protein n=1 Tax=Aspergillus sclerotioniger CBS 115572 TaxID=1450535 RepID=A0A317XAP2_9EURO|nr:hypothetical protein BO94DRAFT_531578 [Aspergillus sclerotioniger CBS 115572]PWY94637.1 hypothetical protein BO94DRAFT_531578 [Aspergillus sclerotioniger CBS 115572]
MSANIEAVPQQVSDDTRRSAYSGLQYLATNLRTANATLRTQQDHAKFYVPSKAIGYRLISQFLEQIELGEPFLSTPPDEHLGQVVFEPHKVRDMGWIISFNYMLLSIVSDVHEKADEKENFRRNVQLALNDSSIFLEPREANIKAFVLLAMHGEEYAAPNISWMLLGHACRQAEALGLHVLALHFAVAHQQHRLCLFWLLFMMDKACALAFGRPAFLPTAVYDQVPLPDNDSLLKFHPHDRAAFGNTQVNPPISTFGCHFLRKSFELSKLMGVILDVLVTGASSETKCEIRMKLDAWHTDTAQILTQTIDTESLFAAPKHLREMALGVNSLKFQYLHVRVLLLKGEEFSALRLSSAREAISLLPTMVSNWSSVYNGVVWQLLYFPFTPFFVIFENIIQHRGPSTDTIQQDLTLLCSTVTYFAEMRSQMHLLAPVCSRLQSVADACMRLAQLHISNCASDSTSDDRSSQGPGAAHSVRLAEQTDHPSETHEAFPSIDAGDLDIANYLDWLPADMDLNAVLPLSENERGNSANRRTLASIFDWFSWDAYYAGIET